MALVNMDDVLRLSEVDPCEACCDSGRIPNQIGRVCRRHTAGRRTEAIGLCDSKSVQRRGCVELTEEPRQRSWLTHQKV